MIARVPLRRCFGLFALGAALAVVAIGCGPGVKDRGTVRGKVTIGNKDLNMGTVLFVTSDNRTGTAMIKEDGTYVMTDAPVGECKIAITIPTVRSDKGPGGMMMPGGGKGMPSGMPGAGGPKEKPSVKPPSGVVGSGGDGQTMVGVTPMDPSKAVKIPDRYHKAESSGLSFTVKKGEQEHNITLNP